MYRRGPLTLCAALSLWVTGCAHVGGLPEYAELERGLHAAAHRPAHPIDPEEPGAVALDPELPPTELLGAQPVDLYIHRALAENRIVQAARYNVLALKALIPQVTALDDPVVSNTIYPIPGVAPQYSIMGYNPYNLLLAQQFPWFGTLRLRGQAAEQDAQVALAELCAAQLDVVATVKRAYFDLAFNERSERILLENRRLAEDFLQITKARYETTNVGLQDVLSAEVAIRDLDRELVRVRQGVAAARADLAQQLHVSPDSDLRTVPDVPIAADVPEQVDRLYRLCVAARPEFRGRLAAIARDERAVELARQRYYPNVTLGLSFMDMSRGNAVSPTASGSPNVGLFVGFNLPIYHKRLDAGVVEAQARALADAKLYEAERDSAYREVKDLFTQAQAQRSILGYFRTDILPRATQALETVTSGYETRTIDFPTLITAWREVLQIQLQIAQVETELGKALASLERAVGVQINAHPPTEPEVPEAAPIPPSPPDSPGPFRPVPPPAGATPDRSQARPATPTSRRVRPASPGTKGRVEAVLPRSDAD
ncbi:MAG TPA: TolC family protein [Isosphaeraceae bacterium]|nr:TolC family protein [Isosphaeraceae bacterium]